MKKQRCEKCSFRAKYEASPKSFLGRLWRWHSGWCPGWQRYLNSLPEKEREKIIESHAVIDGK